ncbi:MAG: protein-export membrane protein SecF [marine bacterium B5-7]|nr:MAG: protein-export membrane protein SecF [marine bacterium B5-7]
MEFFKKTSIDFMGLRKWCAVLSVLMFVVSIAGLAKYGLNLGLDFTGGTQIQVAYKKPADLSDVRAQLAQAHFDEAVVTSYGDTHNALVKVGQRDDMSQQQLSAAIIKALPGAALQSVEFIGPQVGHELATNGTMALLIAMLITGIYIALRFEWRLAVSSTVALIHDPIIILGFFAIFQEEFDLTALAALLTILGYSLNDTVVVFDRVRENFRKVRKATPAEIINLSVNQTLSRTIMTSALTFMAVLALYLYGGPKIHSFSLAFIIGIIVGTYSSIYVAGALSVALGLTRADLIPKAKPTFEEG